MSRRARVLLALWFLFWAVIQAFAWADTGIGSHGWKMAFFLVVAKFWAMHAWLGPAPVAPEGSQG